MIPMLALLQMPCRNVTEKKLSPGFFKLYDLKKMTSILLSFSFLINCIMMPFCNFQDTVSAKALYELFRQSDGDGNVLEFIANDMLNMSCLFEDEDDDKTENEMPGQERPLPPIQISQGSLFCSHIILLEEKEMANIPRVYSAFVKDTYKFDLSLPVFHPPAVPA
jgi:hypothetical protein